MTIQDVLRIAYGAGIVVFMSASAIWFEFNRTLGTLAGRQDVGEFYMIRILLALAWPVSMPTAVCVVLARRHARRLLAAQREAAEVDAVVARALAGDHR